MKTFAAVMVVVGALFLLVLTYGHPAQELPPLRPLTEPTWNTDAPSVPAPTPPPARGGSENDKSISVVIESW